jgi:hypothetical protein
VKGKNSPTDKAIWTVRTAKLCPKCIKEMEAEYIVRPTHEVALDVAKDILEKGYCDRCHEKSVMLRRRRYTMNARTLKAKGYADRWREYMD